jgi:subtilase family serine protease
MRAIGSRPRLYFLLCSLLTLTFPPLARSERTLVALRGRHESALCALLEAQQDPASPEYRHWVTPAEFGRRFGASPRELKRVERWLRADGCRIRRSTTRRHVECVGSHPGPLPADVAPAVEDVLDLDARLEIAYPAGGGSGQPRSATQDGQFFFAPQEYATFYDLAGLHTAGIDGRGQRIGIVGTVPVDPAEIANFRAFFGLPALVLEQRGTPASNGPGEQDLLEANLDVSWSGAVAPGASVVLSITSGTLVEAIRDLVDLTDVWVISLSLELIPSAKTRAYIRQSLKLFQQAAAQGKTVLVASGDFGALRMETPKPKRGVGSFAQSPFVTAVGGTSPSPGASGDGTYGSEVVWQDGTLASGGGRSKLRRPSWQKGLGSATRTVPDVSLAASGVYPVPDNGDLVLVAGTSAAAPAWAGIIAMLNQQKGRPVGPLNATLYGLGNAQAMGGAAVFHDIVEGSSQTTLAKGFPAKPGYDLATGWGTPIGSALFAAFP